MFNMKNDDMDELFRKAAENYEVDTGKASNWDALSKALQNADALHEEDEDRKKKRRFFFFWWLLLLPGAWIMHNAGEKTGTNPGKNAITQSQEQTRNNIDGNNIAEEKPSADFIGENNNIPENISADPKELNKKTGHIHKNENYTDEPVKNNSVKSIYTGQVRNNKKNKIKNNQHNLFIVDKENREYKITENDKNGDAGVNIPYGDYNENITGSLQYVYRDHDGKALPVISFEKIPANKAPGIEDIGNSKNTDSSLQPKKNEAQQHYFYATAVASPDLSAVKFQRISGTGSSMGVLLGYRINNHWHIESGAMWEKKVYYTRGEYFDKSKLSDYYRNVEMISVDGSCRMITIPVNVRYNIHAGKKSNWFIAGGMSSYLMNGEYYNYTYRHYGGQPVTKGYGYKSSEKNWMTVVNVNMGYERNFLKSFNLRVEPYFRIPVAGVGTGNLSLTSGGIYIGIGKRF